jgi:hypothetical protein
LVLLGRLRRELNAARLNADHWTGASMMDTSSPLATHALWRWRIRSLMTSIWSTSSSVISRALIFNLDHQVQTVEPVDPQIISEVRLIRNAFDVDTQMVGN